MVKEGIYHNAILVMYEVKEEMYPKRNPCNV